MAHWNFWEWLGFRDNDALATLADVRASILCL
jgi:hypothetical protein